MSHTLERLRERTDGYTLTPAQFAILAYVALGALTVIVFTGAAVRLTGSGLGCPTWPKCYGNVYPPLRTHAVIEFSNRLITVPVSIAAGLAWVGALRRRPYRRDLARLSVLLPLGVVAQAVLGGLTVRGALDYGWVMAHFALSMLILVPAVLLVWRAVKEPAEAPAEREPTGTGRLVLLGGRAGRAGRADDLRGDRRDRRGPARGGITRAEDQPPGLRRARHDGLRHPPPRRDRVRVRAGRARRLVARAPSCRQSGAAAPADGALRADRAAGRRRARSVRDAPADRARMGARLPGRPDLAGDPVGGLCGGVTAARGVPARPWRVAR